MRAPTVLALLVAFLGLSAVAYADDAPTSPPGETTDSFQNLRRPSYDSTEIPGPGAVSATALDTLPQPTPAGPPEGYRGHGMPPPENPPKPDSVVAAPVPEPAAAEIDTPYDEEKALEIKLKSDPEAARRYRSPRKAFFLSLMVPGAGQIYCGSWVKATLFVATEIGLGVGWYQVAVVGARNKERQAERYAALHWRQQRYDSTWARLYHAGSFTPSQVQATAPNRESYCDALYGSSKGTAWSSCLDTASLHDNYSQYSGQFSNGGVNSTDPGSWSGDSVLSFRAANIKDLTSFYDLIGRYPEFSTGWEDNPDNMTVADITNYSDLLTKHATDPSITAPSPWGVSAMQQYYSGLRTRSDELARMQKWFLGGMILNHLAAAFDAALQAGRMNRELLQLQTTWLDGLGVQGGLAWSSGLPAMQARVDWSF